MPVLPSYRNQSIDFQSKSVDSMITWYTWCWLSSQLIFTRSKSTIETRKRCEICSKLTIKTPERRSSVLLLALNIFIFIFFVSVRWTVMKTCNERFNSSWKTSAIWQKRYSRKIFPIKEYEKALILKIYQCQNCIIFTYHIIMFLVMK